jgi:RNA polymerase sigma-70 factor (ECF subfamily)
MHSVDQDLLSRLLAEHGAPLILFAQQWCDCPEDTVQEAFLRLMRERPAPANIVAWLYRVVRNRAVDASRAAARRRRHEGLKSARRDPWFASQCEEQLDASAAVAALESLPVDEREVLVLRLWSGRSYQEIGELTGTSTSTAQRRFESGLAALREMLRIESPT